MARALSHIGLFVATRWEQRAARAALSRIASPIPSAATRRYRPPSASWGWLDSGRHGCRLTLIQSGVGPEASARAARELFDAEPCDLIMSVGFACALTPSRPGDLLIGTDALLLPDAPGVPNVTNGRNQPSPVTCDVVFGEAALHAAKAAGVPARTGRIMTAGRVLVQATEKQAVAAASLGIGLDMESAALGAIAMEHRVAFLIARTVSDLADEDLPLDFNLFLRPSGWARGALGLLRPASLVGLRRLRRQTALASGHLATFLERFLQDVLRGQP